MPDSILAMVLGLAATLGFAGVSIATPLLMPLFARYAMARPNARSSHTIPTPQGGGAPVVAAVALICFLLGTTGLYRGIAMPTLQFHTLVLLACIALALMGAADDIRPMPSLSRLAMQMLLAAIVLYGAPETWRLFPDELPLLAERALSAVALVWMVNLTNFMDGIDGMVSAEAIPVATTLALLALAGYLDAKAGVIAAALAGAMLAFAGYNRHPAKVFLGDVGSLPIGFMLGALIFQLAATQSMAAALLLPAYFVTDATLTLLAGWRDGHDVTKPHRRHAYQAAVDAGWSAPQVTRAVLVTNIALAALCVLALLADHPMTEAVLLALGYGATFLLIRRFRAGKPTPTDEPTPTDKP